MRKHGGYDPAYEGPVWSTPTQAREAIGLAVIAVAHAPLFPIAPFYTATIWYCLRRYRRDHRHAHLDPAWARDHLTWHYEHHMGDQDKNFGIVWAWVDLLAGTREVGLSSAPIGENGLAHAKAGCLASMRPRKCGRGCCAHSAAIRSAGSRKMLQPNR